ncbi:CHASE domain-containing protein [Arsukibacterium sp.]|uniref:CHASE domain-containing protein n=1 Tax=Arsukibacterium sp. TaxID=1977258 RepID=UPI002FD99EA5
MNDKITHKARTNTEDAYKTLLFNRGSIIAWASLVLGLCFTGLASHNLNQLNQASAENAFNLHAEDIVENIEKRLQDHELILLSAASLKRVNQEVSRQQWRDFVNGLSLSERYPGIQGVGYTKVFPASQLAAHEAAIRAEGFADYQVRPQGQRDIYSAITYLEPFTGRNLAAFGYDMYSEPTRRAAMQRAVAENATSISAKVTLVQETHGRQQAGFLMYVPIYRHNSLLDLRYPQKFCS